MTGTSTTRRIRGTLSSASGGARPSKDGRRIAGRPMPTRGSARWHLPGGDFTYADLEPIAETFALNVATGENM